jgi:hypothetical protein
LAFNLESCFTSIESPESKGVVEAFVKTFKRDYVRVSPIPNARCRPAAFRVGLPLTRGIHHALLSTRYVSGVTGVNSRRQHGTVS